MRIIKYVWYGPAANGDALLCCDGGRGVAARQAAAMPHPPYSLIAYIHAKT